MLSGSATIGLMSKSGAACFLSCRLGMTLGVSLEMVDVAIWTKF